MKINNINVVDNFSGTILIPVFETHAKSLIPIEFHGVSVASKVFYGKKDTHYVVDKYNSTHIFIGIGKDSDYKSMKTILEEFRHFTKICFIPMWHWFFLNPLPQNTQKQQLLD